ncbi:glycosyltransferase [uncultured Lamprocystis sp.]|uniref:glycosyltransferase n=1 Tax=uncultured Lamprocystis sp. TaxID=543132 RepID=UPI0025E76BB2|nr:glycosyltransferase [uncultured Lamprocystis sp.]
MTRTIAGTSHYQGGEDWLVANSAWTADLLHLRLGLISNRVIFPPVADAAPTLPWEQREDGFVLRGRVSHQKRIERMIDNLGRVRAAGHDVHLHIVGAVGDDGYGRAIRDQIARNAAWCFADGYLVGTAKMALLAQHRFAIHGCTGEAFGISVAEYVKAGCIPFVPNQGGPAEIVMSDELIYRDQDDAVAKVVRVLESRLWPFLPEAGRCARVGWTRAGGSCGGGGSGRPAVSSEVDQNTCRHRRCSLYRPRL